MKNRRGFVSNSSSSSFIIQKKYLNNEQLNMIYDHINVAKGILKEDMDYDMPWDIKNHKDNIRGSTMMDNFDMHYFLTEIVKVDEDHIEWDD